ncbi:GntR family transcriptional regulator [Saccharopolyspora mangrovi]|uniref:GntR family transcriptional regulator n=1 Tax=Saccharopolyspora mangrovi TaxID=3082379 RepID=A0ABU6A4A5_9PSEU|nr:GntR family transcriptional regulator [Saccharopolyspora sp. S2-29]MEB3366398.1 GntR family transcriptional regulator [Saccharopolyspora sp. S2-29]
MSADTGPSLTEAVMEHVRSAVVEGTMRPQEWYSVYQLSDELGVSRSPVREGLLRLEEAGLIRFVRNRGFQIIPTTAEDVAEIFSIRLALEVPAAHRAALHADESFAAKAAELRRQMCEAAEQEEETRFFAVDQQLHGIVLTAGGMRRGYRIVDQLRVSTRLLGPSTAGRSRDYSDIIAEHDPIVAAILAGDGHGAARAMREHLEETAVLLVGQALRYAERSEDPQELWTRLRTGFDS